MPLLGNTEPAALAELAGRVGGTAEGPFAVKPGGRARSGKGDDVKALVYKRTFKVAVEQVPDPKIEAPTDVIVRVTSRCICGSDLHRYEGRTGAEPGICLRSRESGRGRRGGPGRSHGQER